jgi:hypothetical protein
MATWRFETGDKDSDHAPAEAVTMYLQKMFLKLGLFEIEFDLLVMPPIT